MKKLFYCAALAAAIISASACSNSETKNQADSASDSVETVAPDTNTQKEAEVAEVPAAEPVNPEEALSLEVTKKNLKHVPESSYSKGTWTVKVTNNSNTPVNGSDYVVAYTENVEDSNADGFFYVDKKRKAEGKDVAPGESVEIILKSKGYTQNFKNPKIKAVKK